MVQKQYLLFFVCLMVLANTKLFAQTDTTKKDDGFFLANKKGLLGKLGKSISGAVPEDTVIKNDETFTPYKGLIINKIIVEQLSFGRSVNDTNWEKRNFTTRIADQVHKQTRERIIRNNLFFSVGDKVYPYLMADNERFLREQFYLQDARIEIQPNEDDKTVDVIIITKDVFSLGGSAEIKSNQSAELVVNEENFLGVGDKIAGKIFYDQIREQKVGFGAEYTRRNINGTFANFTLGFQNYKPAFNSGRNEETVFYSSLTKPLVSPYFPLTFTLSAEHHITANQYIDDSSYKRNFKYEYIMLDAWAAFNLGAKKILNRNDPNTRLRKFIAARIFQTKFNAVPRRYENIYNYQYADVWGVLSSFTLAKQNFYKARFVYGFGRNEDIPEGFSASVIAGFTDKEERNRSYYGLDVQRTYFSKSGNYFNYAAKFGTYLHAKDFEDVTWLVSLDYFSRLKRLSKLWNQRTFVSASFTRVNNIVLYEPLFISSIYGLPEFTNTGISAELRGTVKAEMVFFNKWSLYGFKFAPFIFGGVSFLTPRRRELDRTDGYTSIGAGIRSRNENLIFGTMELKAYYFPRVNIDMTNFKIEFTTDLRFKYSSQFVKRPEFVVVN
jgi:hypothetical protein